MKGPGWAQLELQVGSVSQVWVQIYNHRRGQSWQIMGEIVEWVVGTEGQLGHKMCVLHYFHGQGGGMAG